MSDPDALIRCDIASTEGGQNGPYGWLLREATGFDELTVEGCFTRGHLPKVDIYDEYLIVALFSFHLSEKRWRVETVEVDMYVGNNYVVCVPHRPLRELDRVRQRPTFEERVRYFLARQRRPHGLRRGGGRVPADYEQASAMMDGIEDRLPDENPEGDAAVLDSLFHLPRANRAEEAVPLREVASVLLRPTTRRILEESAAHSDDVRDHLIRVVDMIDTMRDYLMDSLHIYT